VREENIMKNFLLGAAGAMAFFSILYLPYSIEIRYFAIAMLCLIILMFYIGVALFKNPKNDWKMVSIIAIPTVVMVVMLGLNSYFSFMKTGVYIWVIYALATGIALKIAGRPAYPR
jgi:hypothetical protein